MQARSVALGVAIAALVGAVAMRHPSVKAAVVGAANLVGVSLTPENTSLSEGPSYLLSSQAWYGGAAASAVSPSVSQQVAGAQASPIPQFDCGCY